jgi:hypothetical protein
VLPKTAINILDVPACHILLPSTMKYMEIIIWILKIRELLSFFFLSKEGNVFGKT